MDQLLSTLQIRTAIPFGYAIFFLILVIATISSITIIVLCVKKRMLLNIQFLISFVTVLFCVAIWSANFLYPDKLNLNPTFSEGDLIGNWALKSSTLQLNSDGQAHFTFEGLESSGGWAKHGDFQLMVEDQSSMQEYYFRVIQFSDTFRIIPDFPRDPDQWNGNLGYQRVE